MIRRATTDDIDDIAGLEALLFDNSMSPMMLTRELEVGQGFVIGTPLEAYALVREDGELLDLTRLAVQPAHQGRGLGAALLEHIIHLGRPVMLTVKKDNARALRLYRSRGFEIAGHVTAASAWVLRRAAWASAHPST